MPGMRLIKVYCVYQVLNCACDIRLKKPEAAVKAASDENSRGELRHSENGRSPPPPLPPKPADLPQISGFFPGRAPRAAPPVVDPAPPSRPPPPAVSSPRPSSGGTATPPLPVRHRSSTSRPPPAEPTPSPPGTVAAETTASNDSLNSAFTDDSTAADDENARRETPPPKFTVDPAAFQADYAAVAREGASVAPAFAVDADSDPTLMRDCSSREPRSDVDPSASWDSSGAVDPHERASRASSAAADRVDRTLPGECRQTSAENDDEKDPTTLTADGHPARTGCDGQWPTPGRDGQAELTRVAAAHHEGPSCAAAAASADDNTLTRESLAEAAEDDRTAENDQTADLEEAASLTRNSNTAAAANDDEERTAMDGDYLPSTASETADRVDDDVSEPEEQEGEGSGGAVAANGDAADLPGDKVAHFTHRSSPPLNNDDPVCFRTSSLYLKTAAIPVSLLGKQRHDGCEQFA